MRREHCPELLDLRLGSGRPDGLRIRQGIPELASPGRAPTRGAGIGGELVPRGEVRVAG
jgi:hypothetical protein